MCVCASESQNYNPQTTQATTHKHYTDYLPSACADDGTLDTSRSLGWRANFLAGLRLRYRMQQSATTMHTRAAAAHGTAIITTSTSSAASPVRSWILACSVASMGDTGGGGGGDTAGGDGRGAPGARAGGCEGEGGAEDEGGGEGEDEGGGEGEAEGGGPLTGVMSA